MSWLLELGMLVLIARAGSETFRRLRVNPLIGEITAGILLAAALGLMNLSLDRHVLEIFAELGILFMLFLIGLETEFKQLSRVGWAAFLVGALGVVVPFITGFGLGRALGMDRTACMFLASALMATSVAATVRVFMELNYVNNTPSRIVLAAAVIDDIIGLFIFSLVLAFSAPGTTPLLRKLLSTSVFLFLLLPLLWFFLPRLNNWLVSTLGEESKDLALVGLLLLVAYLAGICGLAPIIGAFSLGIILNRRHQPQIETLVKPFYLLLAPVFFLSIGLQMDLRSIGATLGLALLLSVLAILSKAVAAFAGALIARLPYKEALIVGIAMVPRGEVGLIIAGIGRKMDLINQELFTATVCMCVLTVLIAPAPLRWLVDSIRKNAAPTEGVPLHES